MQPKGHHGDGSQGFSADQTNQFAVTPPRSGVQPPTRPQRFPRAPDRGMERHQPVQRQCGLTFLSNLNIALLNEQLILLLRVHLVVSFLKKYTMKMIQNVGFFM